MPARLFFALTAVVVAASLLDQVLYVVAGDDLGANSGSEGTLLPVGVRVFRMLSFFTVQSNLFVLAASTTLAVGPDRDGRVWRVLRLDALLGISITGLVYWVLLAPSQAVGVFTATNLGLHLASPVLAVLGWLLFGPRPRITWSTVGWALVWPVAWVVATFVRGAITGWYPYDFINAGEVGYASALGAAAGVVALGLVLALLYRGLDRRLSRR